MIANVVHISLNPRGGSERLSISTIKALHGMGYQVDLSTHEKTDMDKLEETYDQEISRFIHTESTLSILEPSAHASEFEKYSIVINTHGDILPYFRKDFSKRNAITYCHFPICTYLIDSKDPDYLDTLQEMMFRSADSSFGKHHLEFVRESYIKMIRNSTVLTNSEFSRQAIFKTFGIDSIVLSPPVDVETFRDNALNSRERRDSILVISRFHPSKKIENAIYLAKLLKEKNISSGMNIVGNILPEQIGYYKYLSQMVKDYDLDGFVNFQVDTPFSKLLNLMAKSSIYFHPLPGEPFGISTVEAMSAGLVPVVPGIGGHTEFVPLKYQFDTFDESVSIIAEALDVPFSERVRISDLTQKFSSTKYVSNFQRIISSITEGTRTKEMVTAPLQKKTNSALS